MSETGQGRWAKKKARKKALKQAKEAKVESYRKTARLRLQEMFQAGIGQKRSLDKENGLDKHRIYSKNTFLTYKRQFRYFVEWLETSHPDAKSIDDARQFVDDYLRYLIQKERSAYSISTTKAALAKVFMTEATEFIKTPPRTRENIKRSRGEVKRDGNISGKKEAQLARFTAATGLRRSEITKITAEDLFFKDGKAYFHVTRGTKGGKDRIAEIVGLSEADTKDLVRWIQSKKGKLFPKLNTNYDNHHYRALYASRVYQKYTRDIEKIPRKEKYTMRKDRAGTVLDRVAMKIASKNLGHNRIDVIAQSYLYTSED